MTIGVWLDVTVVCIRPAVSSKRTRESDTTQECPPATARTPSPARATADREMVHVEPDPGEENPKRRTEKDIKAMVPVIEPARPSNKSSCRRRKERDQHEIDRRCSAPSPDGGGIISEALVFNRIMRKIRESHGELRT